MLNLGVDWWKSDTYSADHAIPDDLMQYVGPKGLALVRLWPNGLTSQGWGLQGKDGADGFMPRYMRGEFDQRRVLYGYEKGNWAFAFVMRSLNIVVIDIDGKNGGLDHASELLGNAVPTLAETSKSGNGYHLYYYTDEVWEADTGFGALPDCIGIVQGVDVRATGCVYHHDTQRWNGRKLAPLPKHIADRLRHRAEQRAAAHSSALKVRDLDEVERLMEHDKLITELKRDIGPGKRNTTLFAIGSQMAEAGVDGWEKLIEDRAAELGLASDEGSKIVKNIGAYAAK